MAEPRLEWSLASELRIVTSVALGDDRSLRSEALRAYTLKFGLSFCSFLVSLGCFMTPGVVLMIMSSKLHSPLVHVLFDEGSSILGLFQLPNHVIWTIFPVIVLLLVSYLNHRASSRTIAAIFITYISATAIYSKIFHSLAYIDGPLGPLTGKVAFQSILDTATLSVFLRGSFSHFYMQHSADFFAIVVFSAVAMIQCLVRVWYELAGGAEFVALYVTPTAVWQGISIFVITVFFLQRLMQARNQEMMHIRSALWKFFGIVIIPLAVITVLDWVARLFPFTGFGRHQNFGQDVSELPNREVVPGEEIIVLVVTGLIGSFFLALRALYLSKFSRDTLPQALFSPLPASVRTVFNVALLCAWLASQLRLLSVFLG